MATYDSKPSVYEANGDGSFTYRWNINEVDAQATTENGDTDTDANAEQKTNWECNEVVVWATVTREKLTASVLASLWDSDYEAKLINDYNAAKEGVFGSKTGADAQKYIERYKTFLSDRKAIKEQIAEDCAALNII
jgi:hypothetical protein